MKRINNPKDLIGRNYAELKVLEYLGHLKKYEKGNKNHYYLCECNCGNKEFTVTRYNLQSGLVKSCGCLKIRRIKENNIKDGLIILLNKIN